MSIAIEDMVDTIGADIEHIPPTFRKVLGYSTGTPDIQWSAAAWARFKGSKVRINQSNDVNDMSGDGDDIEPGACTFPVAIERARIAKARGRKRFWYVMGSQLVAAEQHVRDNGLTTTVDYFVADWSLTREQAISFIEANPRLMAVQYASPTSNPHEVIPGTDITLNEANADLSVTRASWFPVPNHMRPVRRVKTRGVHPKVGAGAAAGGVTTAVIGALSGLKAVHLTPAEVAAIVTAFSAIVGYVFPGAKVTNTIP